MSAVLTPPVPGAATPPPRPQVTAAPSPAVEPEHDPYYRLSVDQYHRMIEKGILTTDHRCELLRGLLVQKMPIDPPHATAVEALREFLGSPAPAGWCFRSQNPVTLADGEPEPDAVLARGGRRDYATRHPSPGEVGLVVEVADTSYKRDRGVKYADYAAAGVPVCWIVDVLNRKVEVFTDPDREAGEYRTVRTFAAGDAVPVELDGVRVGEVPAAELFA